MYEFFEHTADVGLRIRAADPSALFADAGRGLFALIVGDIERVRAERRVAFELRAEGLDDLLFDWLGELLYTFETGHLVFRDFSVTVRDLSLSAEAAGEPFDPDRHGGGHEVKAVTYHAMRVERQGSGWLAEVILDI